MCDRQQVLEAVSQDCLYLACATEELKCDREVVLTAVSRFGRALGYAAEELKRDREIVCRAVKQNANALLCAADELKGDRDIVLEAVSQKGDVLQYAAEELKADPEIVLAAISHSMDSLKFAADSLLEDEAFAVEARTRHYFFKVLALSGRSCIVAMDAVDFDDYGMKPRLLRATCDKLGLQRTGSEVLLYGTDSVPERTRVCDWPGHPSLGIAIEYQLVRYCT
mmetsp:Transcript_63025/g.117221  ORF Transcript_63025/g.117221 Transcript_63025/m.117221 type:complete len:224 (-) Transcript_63025:34-705(-)